MHISEGVLNAPVLVGAAVPAAVGVAIGLRKIDYERLPQVALLGSAFFVASLIHVPIGVSSAHLVLNGICGLLLGWSAFPAILVGLSLQAILFQFGGLTTLGLNTLNMALPGVVFGFLCRRTLLSDKKIIRASGEFICGAGAIALSALMVAASLMATGKAFHLIALPILVAHLPIMVIEGLLTILVVEFIRRVKPEMLPMEA